MFSKNLKIVKYFMKAETYFLSRLRSVIFYLQIKKPKAFFNVFEKMRLRAL